MTQPRWRKASHSNPNDACVEVAQLDNGNIGVRDTKQHGHGPILEFTPTEWTAFTAGVREGEFDDLSVRHEVAP